MVVFMYVIGALCALAVLWRSWRLVSVRQSPKAVLGRGLGLGGILALMGLVGVIPAAVWFVWWALVVVAVAAICIAAWHATQGSGDESPSSAQVGAERSGTRGPGTGGSGTRGPGTGRGSAEQAGPPWWKVAGDGALVVALIAVAFISG